MKPRYGWGTRSWSPTCGWATRPGGRHGGDRDHDICAGDNKLEMAKFAPDGAAVTTTVAGVAAPASAMASLSVESSVAGADIEIDGSFVGSTPSTPSVAPGQHTATVKKKGYADWSRR